MNKENTSKFLGMIKLHFQNFQTGLESVSAWYALLKDHSSEDCWRAYQTYMSEAREFPPNPSHIISLIKAAKDTHITAALAWSNGCKGDPIADEAFRRWGGKARWGMLPDPNYSDNPAKDMQTVSFARKEYLDIYNDLLQGKKHRPQPNEQIATTSDKQLLKQVMGALENKTA